MTDKGLVDLLNKPFGGRARFWATAITTCAVLACATAIMAVGFAADNGWQAEVGKALGKTGAAMPAGCIASVCRAPI